MSYRLIPIIPVVLIFLFVNLTGCGGKKETSKPIPVSDFDLKGKQLSEKYCGACHLIAGPELLDKASWMRVLPLMREEMNKMNMPVDPEDWILLQEYYSKLAPISVDHTDAKKLQDINRIFNPDAVVLDLPEPSNFITLIKYDSIANSLYTGDATGNIYLFEDNLFVKKYAIKNIPIDLKVNTRTGSLEVLGMGSLAPTEKKSGSLIELNPVTGNFSSIIDSLKRPIHFLRHDLDGNGKDEYLISCFGSTTGKVNSGNLSLFALKDGSYHEQVLKQLPGATKTVVRDFNNDGKPDIIALFSQGQESLIMFINRGNLKFDEKILFEFPPVYGVNDFEVADVNGDSFDDIILTNGDNGDYSPVFKFYHGLRLFVNNGKNDFEEQFFFALNGASKVVVRDLDGDNDPDLAVLSMYPNLFVRPQETIVYFENLGKLKFKASYVEKEPSAKWMIMEAGDIDNDGDDDLIVGSNYMLSFTVPNYYKEKWKEESTPVKIFINNSAEKKGQSFWEKFKELFSK